MRYFTSMLSISNNVTVTWSFTLHIDEIRTYWNCLLFDWRSFLDYLDQKNVIMLLGNGRTSASKWCNLIMHRIKIVDFTDQNVLIVMKIQYILVCKIRYFLLMSMWLTPFQNWGSAIFKKPKNVFLVQII